LAVTQSLTYSLPRNRVGSLPITPFPSQVNHRTVTTAETETVPTGASTVVITSDVDVWFSAGTAVVPSSDVTDNTGSFFLKGGAARMFAVESGQTISVIAATGTAHVSFEYFTNR